MSPICYILPLQPVIPRLVGKMLWEWGFVGLHLLEGLAQKLHPQVSRDAAALVFEDEKECIAQMGGGKWGANLGFLLLYHIILDEVFYCLHHLAVVSCAHDERIVGQHSLHEWESLSESLLHVAYVLASEHGIDRVCAGARVVELLADESPCAYICLDVLADVFI